MSTEPNTTGRLSFPEYDEEGLYPSQQVNRLRKEGKLDLAYRYAQQELDDNPEDKYLASALGWVYYDYLKQQHDKINADHGVERYVHVLETIDQFETTYSIPLDDLLADSVCKNFTSSAWELQKAGNLDGLRALVDAPRPFYYEASGLALPFLIAFKDSPEDLVHVVDCMPLWSLLEGRGLAKKSYEGKQIKGDGERLADDYLKALLELSETRSLTPLPEKTERTINNIASMLKKAHEKPALESSKLVAQWEWTPYYLGRVLTKAGRYEEAREFLAPIAVAKPKEEYLQNAFKRACADNPALGEAGPSAYLVSKTPVTPIYVEWINREKGLIGIAVRRIETERSYVYGAKPSTSTYIDRFKIKDRQRAQTLMEGYTYDAQLLPEHAGFAADPVPCTDSEFETVFVKQFSGRFEQVKAFGFVHPSHIFTSGYYVSPKLLEQHPIENLSMVTGRAVAVFKRKSKDTDAGTWRFEVQSFDTIEAPDPADIERTFEGEYRAMRRGDGGFVEDCFIPAKICQDNNAGIALRDGLMVEVRARLSWNKKHVNWGWTAVDVRPVENPEA